MKKQSWIALFILILAANIIAGLIKSQLADYISKPLIIISLGAYFFSQTSLIASPLKKWVLGALFFSWAGDLLLLFQEKDKLFFLLGLSAFLIAHLFYIILFHNIRAIEKIKSNFWLALIVVIYYVSLIAFLSPYLGEMGLPVRIYGIAISFMFMLALHMLFIKNKMAGLYMMTGALLFIISDSVLALNKFYRPFEMAGVIIMLTYGFAQLLIVEGAVQYIRRQERPIIVKN